MTVEARLGPDLKWLESLCAPDKKALQHPFTLSLQGQAWTGALNRHACTLVRGYHGFKVLHKVYSKKLELWLNPATYDQLRAVSFSSFQSWCGDEDSEEHTYRSCAACKGKGCDRCVRGNAIQTLFVGVIDGNRIDQRLVQRQLGNLTSRDVTVRYRQQFDEHCLLFSGDTWKLIVMPLVGMALTGNPLEVRRNRYTMLLEDDNHA